MRIKTQVSFYVHWRKRGCRILKFLNDMQQVSFKLRTPKFQVEYIFNVESNNEVTSRVKPRTSNRYSLVMRFLHLSYFNCSHSSTVVKQLIERKRIVTVHGIAQKLESRSEWHREKERIHFSSIDAWAEIEKKSNVRISTLPIFPLILTQRWSSVRRSIREQHSCVLCETSSKFFFWVICKVHPSGMGPTHYETKMTSEISWRYFSDMD